MLVLGRRFQEKTIITTASGERIVIQIVDIRAGEVRLGIEADSSVSIEREERIKPSTYGRRIAGTIKPTTPRKG